MAAAAAAPAPGSREPIRTLHAQGYVNRSAQARKNYEDARRWLADWVGGILRIFVNLGNRAGAVVPHCPAR
jgi:hypothetical protein